MNPVSNLFKDISNLNESYSSLEKYQYSNYYDSETQKFVNSTDNPAEYERAYSKAPYSYITPQWQYHLESGFKPIVKNTKAIMKEVFNNLNEIDLSETNNITNELSNLKKKINHLSRRNESNNTAIVQEYLNKKSYLNDNVTFPMYIHEKFFIKAANEVDHALKALQQREQALEAQFKFIKKPVDKTDEEIPILEEKAPPFDYLSHHIPYFTPLPRDKLKPREIPVAQQERLNYFRKSHHKKGNLLLEEFNQTVSRYKEAQKNMILIKDQIEEAAKAVLQEDLSDFTLEDLTPVPLSAAFDPPPPPPLPPNGSFAIKTYAQKRAEEAEKQSLKEEDVSLQSFQLDEKGLLMMQLARNEAMFQEARSELIHYLFGGEYNNKEVLNPGNKFNSLTEEQFDFLKNCFVEEAIKLEHMSKVDWETNIYNPGTERIIKTKISTPKHLMTEDEKKCCEKILSQLDSIEKLIKSYKTIGNQLKDVVEPKNRIIKKANGGEKLTVEELIHFEKLQNNDNQNHKSRLTIEKREIYSRLENEVAAFKKAIHSAWNSPVMVIKDARNLVIEIKNGKRSDFVNEYLGK